MIVLLVFLTFIKSKVVPSIGKFKTRIWCPHFSFVRSKSDSKSSLTVYSQFLLRWNNWSQWFWLGICLWYFAKAKGWIWVWSWQLTQSHWKSWNKLWELQEIEQYIWTHKNDFRKRQSSFSQKWRLPESEMADWKLVSSGRNNFEDIQVWPSSLTTDNLNPTLMLVTDIADVACWWQGKGLWDAASLRCSIKRIHHDLNSATIIKKLSPMLSRQHHYFTNINAAKSLDLSFLNY